MSFTELQIQLDLNPDNRVNILENVDTCRWTDDGYLFVDSKNSQCYFFNKNGQEDDISKVKHIRNWVFESCTSLTSISIPNSIESIGYLAFGNCTSLTSIKISDSVKNIRDYAFFNCSSLTSISISDSVKSIGDEAFIYCTSLISISIPNSVESIGNWAFGNCASLKSLVFKGKTIDEVKAMPNYPWGIKDKFVIECE